MELIIIFIIFIISSVVIFAFVKQVKAAKLEIYPVTEILTHRKDDAWQELAENYNLTYLPGQNLAKAHLFGNYRNCQLDLKINQKLKDGVVCEFTSLTLFSNKELKTLENKSAILENINSLLTLSNISYPLKGQIDVEIDGQKLVYEQYGVEYDRIYLQVLFDFMYNLLSVYPVLVNSEDRFITDLQVIARYNGLALQPFAKQILQVINVPAREQAKSLHLICPNCLAYYKKEEINLSFKANFDVGCRICHGQRGYIVGKIIAILDNQPIPKISQKDYKLYINWVAHRTIFDFDEIEINQATDEEIERFVVQVGNDTDLTRTSQYKQIKCILSAGCKPSENSLRILRQAFGMLEISEKSRGI